MATIFLMAFCVMVLVSVLVNYIVCIYGFIGNYNSTRGNSINSLILKNVKLQQALLDFRVMVLLNFLLLFKLSYG